MRPVALVLVLLLTPQLRAADAAPPSPLTDPPLATPTVVAETDEPAMPSDAEAILVDLRSADKDVVKGALAAIPKLAGYPRSAQDLLPALLWMADGDDPDLAQAAQEQAEAMGWPKRYCLICVQRLAVREDMVYKMMGLSMLAKLAWEDPAAMTALLEINRNHIRGTGPTVRAFAAVVKARPCRTDLEMQAWNDRAVRFRGRMITALHNGGPNMRPIAEAMLTCNKLDPVLAAEAQAVLDAVPVPTVGSDPSR